MVASAFVNNEPIVVILIPIIKAWSRRNGVAAKQLLIPLSFSTVFGGTTTLIGTTTNLVVSGLQQAKFAHDPSQAVFGFFTITPYGELGRLFLFFVSRFFSSFVSFSRSFARDLPLTLSLSLTRIFPSLSSLTRAPSLPPFLSF